MHYEKTILGSINKDFERKSEKTDKERKSDKRDHQTCEREKE